jgi:hypothetical protein
VRVSVLLIAAGLLGVVAGAWLLGRWAVGVAVIADSVVLVGLGLLRDVPERPASLRRRGT